MPKNPAILLVSLAALALAAWGAIDTLGNRKLQAGIQARQDQILALQSEIQALQQQLQAQQQQIEAATQLANQAGPAVLNELANIQLSKGNVAIGVLLQRYGVQARPPQTAPQSPKPAR